MVVAKTEGVMVKTLRERWLDWFVAAVLLGLFGVAVGGSRAAFSGNVFPGGWQPWWDGFLQNSGTEMLGAFLTFILLEVVRGRRERKAQEAAEERRTRATQDLVRNFIQAQELARLRATQTPEERQPTLDSMNATGLLQGAYLYKANLQEANLVTANLQGTNLYKANLQGATLSGANLQGANLYKANLLGAHLEWANLKEVHLHGADLRAADLDGANLQGATLSGASLQGARQLTVEQLRQADSLRGATLPDGTKLPDFNTWREAFEAWCEMVETDEDGYIKVADGDDNDYC
jgi:hypothetical protein